MYIFSSFFFNKPFIINSAISYTLFLNEKYLCIICVAVPRRLVQERKKLEAKRYIKSKIMLYFTFFVPLVAASEDTRQSLCSQCAVN